MKKFSILCIRCDHIGDLLVSTPAIHRLRTLWPDAEIDVITSPAGRVALEGNPDIDHIFIYQKKSPRSWVSLVPVLLKKHDMVVGFNAGSSTIRLLTRLARGVKKGFLQTGHQLNAELQQLPHLIFTAELPPGQIRAVPCVDQTLD